MLHYYNELERHVLSYNPALNKTLLYKAYCYAAKAHEGQTRKDGSPYITHPLAVANIVADLKLDTDALCAALLHDCIEDTKSTHEDISREFSPTIADLVEGVTKLTRINYVSMEEKSSWSSSATGCTICARCSIRRRRNSGKSPGRPWRSTPPSLTGWVCSASSGSWRIWR